MNILYTILPVTSFSNRDFRYYLQVLAQKNGWSLRIMRRVTAELLLTSQRRQGCFESRITTQHQQLRVDVFGFAASNPIG